MIPDAGVEVVKRQPKVSLCIGGWNPRVRRQVSLDEGLDGSQQPRLKSNQPRKLSIQKKTGEMI